MEKLLPVLAAFGKSVAVQVGGFAGWFYGRILFYGGRAFLEMIEDWVRKAKRGAVQEEKKKEMEKVVESPNSTVEERAKSYEDFINSGH